MPVGNESKYCNTADDCVPVGCSCHCSGCGGFWYEDIVNQDYVEFWYDEKGCSPAQDCPDVCCTPVIKVCEENTCKVKPRIRANIPQELLEKEVQDKELCVKTGGTWVRDEIWVGECQCASLEYSEFGRNNFIETRGCVNQKTLCEESQGIWEKPKVSMIENRTDISKENCITKDIYTLMEWDAKNNFCILKRIDDPNPKCLK